MLADHLVDAVEELDEDGGALLGVVAAVLVETIAVRKLVSEAAMKGLDYGLG